jgi:hypothetical protein
MGVEGGEMPLSGDKRWYQSKTIWTGLFAVIVVAYNEAIANGFGLPQIPEFVYALLGALGIYSRSVAKTTVH